MEQLKPCPFCGESLKFNGKYMVHPSNDCILANCDSEYGELWFSGEDMNSVEAWDRRAYEK